MPQLDVFTFLPQFFYFVIFFVISFLIVFIRILSPITALGVVRQIKPGSKTLKKLAGYNFTLKHVFIGLGIFQIILTIVILTAPIEVVLFIYKIYRFFSFIKVNLIIDQITNSFGYITIEWVIFLIKYYGILILSDPQILFCAFMITSLIIASSSSQAYPEYLKAHQAYLRQLQAMPFTQQITFFQHQIISVLMVIKLQRFFWKSSLDLNRIIFSLLQQFHFKIKNYKNYRLNPIYLILENSIYRNKRVTK